MDCAAGRKGKEQYLGWIYKKEVKQVNIARAVTILQGERMTCAKIQRRDTGWRCLMTTGFTTAAGKVPREGPLWERMLEDSS